MTLTQILSVETGLAPSKIEAVSALLNEGATLPFIARYRKEKTGGLDEVAIADIRDRMERYKAVFERKEAILSSLNKQGVITKDLEDSLEHARTLSELEDIYLPFRPKRRTRALIAREKGLEPLAQLLLSQTRKNPAQEALHYINPDLGIENTEDALAGARDILAEIFNDDLQIRTSIRRLFAETAKFESTVKKGQALETSKYKDWFSWSEPAASAPSHRIHAMIRGAAEGILTVHVLPDEEKALAIMAAIVIKHPSPAEKELRLAIKDAYKRLLSKSMETEALNTLKLRADTEAITVFTRNLKALLLAPPLGQKEVLAIDPGFRSGCKLVCLDRQGKLLHHDIFYLDSGSKNPAEKKIKTLISKFNIQAIAVGSGTAGRETEQFLKELKLPESIPVIRVDESGASVYSASQAARDEFPDHDITVRGAVSIGRRLMDPLAELVKIEPKSIGVGQYQHDVDQTLLAKALSDVVTFCVNRVGVEVNTASRELLSHVSGLTPTTCKNLIAFRDERGALTSRQQLMEIPGIGPKTFEMAAGFLRIRGGTNPLDNTGIHPESYPVARAMARDAGIPVQALMNNDPLLDTLDLKSYVTKDIGLPTLKDILFELKRPGRDPRSTIKPFSFHEGIFDIKDLKPGMTLPGIITNVTGFGAFVDIGIHENGLIHISRMADHFVKDPGDILKVGQQVKVTVIQIDLNRKRISLSLVR